MRKNVDCTQPENGCPQSWAAVDFMGADKEGVMMKFYICCEESLLLPDTYNR